MSAPEDAGRTEGEPTPRPWAANLDSDYGDYTIWGPSSDDDFVANIGTEPGVNEIVAFDVAAANARYIVRAVNSHDALVSALEWYARGIVSLQSEKHFHGAHGLGKPRDPHCPMCDNGAIARAALEKAKAPR